MQEVSGTIERTKEQLSEIQQQVSTLEDTQPVYVKIRVFTSRVPLPPLEEEPSSDTPAADGSAAGDTDTAADSQNDRDGDAATQQSREPKDTATTSSDALTDSGTTQANGAVKAAPEGDADNKGGAEEGAEAQEEEKAEPEIEYEVMETTSVQFTVDRYTEIMGLEVEALQAQVEELTAKRDAVMDAFKEMVAHFGERPQAVKESEWWSDFLRFLKPFNKIQTAIIKQRVAEQEAAERKRKKELSGGTTHRQRG